MASRARSPSATRQAQLRQSTSANLGEPQYHDQDSKVDFSSFAPPIQSNGSLALQYEQINGGMDAGYPGFVAPIYNTHVGSGTSNYADQALDVDPMATARRVSGQMQPSFFQGMGSDIPNGMNGSFEYPQSDLPASGLDPSLLGYTDNLAQANSTASTGGLGFDVGPHLQPDISPGAPHNSTFYNQSTNAQMNHSSDNLTSNMTTNPFPTTMGGRDSLDPSAAMFPQQDWTHLGAYRSHARTPSDNISEFSSHSNQASPYLGNLDTFDNSQASPLLNPSHDSAFLNDLSLQQFTLENLRSSPAHSPGHSPRISPQPSFPPLTSDNMFGMTTGGLGPSYPQNALETFPSMPSEAFPTLNNMSPGNEYGAADQVSPPEIAIDFAPPTMRLPHDSQQLSHAADNSLSPPLRTLSRNRMRAKSDSYAGGTRPQTPGIPSRGRSPSLQPRDAFDNLSPFDNTSRSPSLDRGRAGSLGNRSRSASNLSDHRDQVLAMAHPERTPSNGAGNQRVQKHPATFQCNLCPKRFTRAYNLRSHLRTHTDERPFKCTVCNKAFARQHDRKRHEGLHSGEKKFICRGNLQNGAAWGCGRRFARADALGRHFRSEAGRVCIKPLLDEEAAEKRKWADEQQQARFAAGMTVDQSLLDPSQMDMMANMNFLPAAILQQYPALAQIDWGALQHTSNADEYEGGGRSSFDASSGGEFDLSETEMSDYPDAGMGMLDDVPMDFNGQPRQPQPHLGGYGSRTGDYLSDFDGR